MKNKYYRLGYAPVTMILDGLIFDSKREANRRAKDENRAGEFRGRGVKAYACDSSGNVILPVAS